MIKATTVSYKFKTKLTSGKTVTNTFTIGDKLLDQTNAVQSFAAGLDVLQDGTLTNAYKVVTEEVDIDG